jgi:hypothetical protein
VYPIFLGSTLVVSVVLLTTGVIKTRRLTPQQRDLQATKSRRFIRSPHWIAISALTCSFAIAFVQYAWLAASGLFAALLVACVLGARHYRSL